MPKQEVFFEREIGDRRVEVLKTYDQFYAREAFDNMDEAARTHLWKALGIDLNYDPEDVPLIHTSSGTDFLRGELLENAREDGNLKSFFVVVETRGATSTSLYTSPDWPSAEEYAEGHLAQVW